VRHMNPRHRAPRDPAWEQRTVVLATRDAVGEQDTVVLWPARSGSPPIGSTSRASGPDRPPRRARKRLLRRTVRTGAAITVTGLAAGIALLVSTPGVGDAAQRTVDLDRAHHIAAPTTPVPARFAAALIATEDSRFYDTPGIDPVSLVRVAATAVTGGNPGAATLEQQLAKQLYTGARAGGITTKAEQVGLAVKLDLAYSKQQILQMYAAVVYFGHGYWGLDAASHGYFGLAPQQLTWGQAALLAGLVQAPSAYDPVTHPDLAHTRQQHVLGRLVATGQLTPSAAAAAAAEPLNLAEPLHVVTAAPSATSP
jgi:membrane peptidoglycan carboxypeptidase